MTHDPEIDTLLQAQGLRFMTEAQSEFCDRAFLEREGSDMVLITSDAVKRIQWFANECAVLANRLERQVAAELDPEGEAERLSSEILQQFDDVVALADRLPPEALREPANDRS